LVARYHQDRLPHRAEPKLRKLVGHALVGIFLITGMSLACADEPAVAPPKGSMLLLKAMADGVQVYNCEAKDKGYEWNFKAPEADLFDERGRQIGAHFAGPTWKLGDGSAVVGEVVAKADAPEAGAIAWLLLRAKSHEGSGELTAVAFIRRSNTKGGVAPAIGCDADHLSEQARMRYSAEYQFFGMAK
jgi:Protein of unknown function (DUF3455)